MRASRILQICLLTLAVDLAIASAAIAQSDRPFIGRWDLTVQSADGHPYPSWLEIQRSGYRTLVGSFVGQFGSARPVSKIENDNGTIRFTIPPQYEDRKTDMTFDARLEGDVLRGETTDEKGNRITWEARRAPALNHAPPTAWSDPIELFNGRDLTGWKPRHAGAKHGWQVKDGLFTNVDPGSDLVSEERFNDFKLLAEFRVPKGSNSGLYLRGRYEVQIEDGIDSEPDSHGVGGVYGFLTPISNPAKPAGEWQTMEITLIGRRLTVVYNGEKTIDRQVIPGITGGALDSHEGEPGPLMIQGDHGQVEFRRLTITPAASTPADK
jgi:hypothetical protein